MCDSVLLTTAYLPPLEYVALIAKHKTAVIEKFENYQKQSYRSRCHILSANGPLSLTIPVVRTEGTQIPIQDVRIDYSKDWQKQHWKAIVSAYKSSPFFDYYMDDFEPFFSQTSKSLLEFNTDLLKLVLDLCSIKADITFTEQFQLEAVNDYRFSIHPKKELPDIKEKGRYYQVFAPKFGFTPGLSVIDLLFNEGPDSLSYLRCKK